MTLEGLHFSRDRRLKGTNLDLRLNELAKATKSSYSLLFTNALENYLYSKRVPVVMGNRSLGPRGSEDWLNNVTLAFENTRPEWFGFLTRREMFIAAVELFLESEKKK